MLQSATTSRSTYSIMNLAICAICNNERPYLLEWIAFQKHIGFGSVFIYDNVSDDGSSELLAALDRCGEITRIHWPRRPGVVPQTAAYAHFLHTHAQSFDWVLVCDIDEFLMIEHSNVPDFITRAVTADKHVSAIAIPWLVFGSEGREQYEDGLVLERFTRCEASPSQVVKTLFRPRSAFNMRTHICDLTVGCYLDNTFHPARWSTHRPIHLQHPCPGNALIYHYFTKSRQEWIERRRRGRADRIQNEQRDLKAFDKYHRQPQSNRFALTHVPELRRRVEKLQNSLNKGICAMSAEDFQLIVVNSSWIIGKNDDIPPASTIRIVINNMHECYTTHSTALAGGYTGFCLNTRWLDTAIHTLRISAVGCLQGLTIIRTDFPGPKAMLSNVVQWMPSAEQLLFDLATRIGTNKQRFAYLKTITFPAFRKFPEYGDLLHGLVTHEDIPSSLRTFLERYKKQHGEAADRTLSRLSSPHTYIGRLLSGT